MTNPIYKLIANWARITPTPQHPGGSLCAHCCRSKINTPFHDKEWLKQPV